MNNLFKILPVKNVYTLIAYFFLLFGLTLLVSIIFTEDYRGILVNIICSGLFIIISILIFFLSKKVKEK